MRVNEIMMEPVVTVSSQATLATAIDLLIQNGISGLPVMNNANQLCGILSEGDMLRRLELGTEAKPRGWWAIFTASDSPAEAYRRANGRRVADVMSPIPVTIDEDASLSDAAELMETNRFRRLPVMRNGALVGMLTRADFVRALRPFATPTVTGRSVSDGDIRAGILSALADQTWSASCAIDVVVAGGKVTLEGSVPNDDQRRAARVVAENVEGVTSVTMRLQVFEAIVIPGF